MLSKQRIEGNFLNLIKDIYEKPTANIILNSERQCFPPKIRNKTRVSELTTSLQHYTGISSQCSKARKRNERHPY